MHRYGAAREFLTNGGLYHQRISDTFLIAHNFRFFIDAHDRFVAQANVIITPSTPTPTTPSGNTSGSITWTSLHAGYAASASPPTRPASIALAKIPTSIPKTRGPPRSPTVQPATPISATAAPT